MIHAIFKETYLGFAWNTVMTWSLFSSSWPFLNTRNLLLRVRGCIGKSACHLIGSSFSCFFDVLGFVWKVAPSVDNRERSNKDCQELYAFRPKWKVDFWCYSRWYNISMSMCRFSQKWPHWLKGQGRMWAEFVSSVAENLAIPLNKVTIILKVRWHVWVHFLLSYV